MIADSITVNMGQFWAVIYSTGEVVISEPEEQLDLEFYLTINDLYDWITAEPGTKYYGLESSIEIREGNIIHTHNNTNEDEPKTDYFHKPTKRQLDQISKILGIRPQ